MNARIMLDATSMNAHFNAEAYLGGVRELVKTIQMSAQAEVLSGGKNAKDEVTSLVTKQAKICNQATEIGFPLAKVVL